MPWETVSPNSEVLAVHAALLPTGQVLYFGGSEHNAAQNLSGNASDLDNSRLFNPGGGTLIETIGSPTTDVFCSGHAFLADGRLLVAGGTEEWGGGHEGHDHALNFLGERGCWVYHPRARRWERVRDLNFEPGTMAGGGRWYPTLVTLADGQVLAVAGHPRGSDSRHNNDTPERYSPGSDTWTTLPGERLDEGVRSRYYPRFHLLTDGNVFFVSPVNGACRIWNPFTGTTVSSFGSAGGGLYDSTWDFPSVLLPLLPGDGYAARILIAGDVNAKRIDLSQPAPAWQNTSARQGAAAGRQRRFSCAVTLPTGQVFVSGGVNGGTSDMNAVLEGEIYTPGIDWNTGQYGGADSWQSVEAAAFVRNYHSTALLLPNGRVWVAGSSKNADAGDPTAVAEMNIEVYKPPYDGAANRPQITAAPPSAGYAQTFEVRTPEAADVRRVALTRCGSNTHAFDADQRYVALQFEHEGGDRLRVTSPPNSRIAPPGYYLLWLVNAAGNPCQEARFIRICSQRILLVTDRSTFSRHEVEALGTPAVFANAFYVVLDGFLPSEVGTPPVAPTINLTRPDGSAVPGMTAVLNRVLFEDDTVPPDIAQRITFVFNVRFSSLQAFDQIPAADTFQNVTLRATHGGNAEQATLVLSKNPNPYMRDGQVHWLSTDLRVFKMRPGLTRAGVTLGSDPTGFIQQLLSTFNTTPSDDDHPFRDISEDVQESSLELASHVAGQPVFNFAVAKVRYRAPAGVDASDVRVFFRLFTTAATGFQFNSAAYPRDGNGADASPLLGLQGNEVLSIPFFAEPRVADLRNQVDVVNRRTVEGAGSAEVTAYFGCWLDFNQDTPRFPLHPPHNGSGGAFSGALLSIQQLIRNHHCCLAAEIHYPPDPIPTGATPGSHDNLSQRNLVVVESDNPGGPASHTVQSTFEIRPSGVPIVVPQAFGILPPPPPPPADEEDNPLADIQRRERIAALPEKGAPRPEARERAADDQKAAIRAMERYQPALTYVPARKPRVEADELLIRWNNLPRDSRVSLYMPDVDARQVVAAAAARGGPPVLVARDDHTVVCRVGDVSYVPVPGPRATNIPGLLSIELPPTVVKGQSFTISVHQISGYPRRVLGSFQFTIPVTTADRILPGERRKLAVLRHVSLAIPTGNRWRPVFDRYLLEVAGRVRELGGDPDRVQPSPGEREIPGEQELPDGKDPAGRELTGKVCRLIYDCHGDFAGFVLDLCPGERVFRSCGGSLERLVREACEKHWRVRVIVDPETPSRILRFEVYC